MYIFLSGHIRNGRWSAHFCGWNLPASALTQFQRNALRYGYYRNNCGCGVSSLSILVNCILK